MASCREFLAHGLTAAALAAFPAGVFASTRRAARPMTLLVLGGTGFLGPAERRAAAKSGLTPQREADVLAAWHARSARRAAALLWERACAR
ncbi:hypothetical protein LDO31_02045 [Luteimonas sp. XNQY3]|nr:hypothetical protein [Luteimonas sp. XNQY3]MCD9005034.1 hypothetical protein [Luteimonas sp. XNQY3]